MPEIRYDKYNQDPGSVPTHLKSLSQTRRWGIGTAKLYRGMARGQLKFLKFKRKMLAKAHISETKMINKIGIERSFSIVQSSQKIGIQMEKANFFVSGIATLLTAAALVYAQAKGIPYEIYERGFRALHESPDYAMRLLFKSALWTSIASGTLNIAGNVKDWAQQFFLSAIKASVDKKIRPRINKHLEKFTTFFYNEFSMDGPLVLFPIPFVICFTRKLVIKLKGEASGQLDSMKQVYLNHERKKQEAGTIDKDRA